MGIQINGTNDTISAADGSLTISGASGNLTGDLTGNVTGNLTGNVNSTGIVTATSFSGSGSALTGVGKILKVAQTVKTDTFSGTSTSTETDVPGMSVSIQPDAAGSKILVQVTIQVTVGGSYAGQHISLKRGSDLIFAGTDVGSRNSAALALSFDVSTGSYGPATKTFTYLDSPTYTLGDTLTYKLTHRDTLGTANTIYINRSVTDSNESTYVRTASNIIVMEVAA